MLMPYLVLVLPINKPKTQLLDRVLPEHKTSHWFLLHHNQEGRSKYILYLSAFPHSSPAPSLASYIPPTRELGTFCAKAKQAT